MVTITGKELYETIKLAEGMSYWGINLTCMEIKGPTGYWAKKKGKNF